MHLLTICCVFCDIVICSLILIFLLQRATYQRPIHGTKKQTTKIRTGNKGGLAMRKILIPTVILIATLMWLPSFALEQEDAAQKVKASMSLLQSDAAKLGSPKLEGTALVANLDTPALYFGSTKMNNNFDLVDSVVKEMGGTATIFVKNGENFVRVATNVKKDDGSRAIGTVLDPKGPVIQSIRNNQPYYGEANILGKSYMTAYVPIRDAANKVIGIYYVGYMK
jgi:hypothetical protein